jgi:hydrogenase maturation factor
MSILETMTSLFRKEPNKTFREAEITDGDDILTKEGMYIFTSWLLHSKYAEEFKKAIADEIVAKKNADKKTQK